LLWKSEKPVLDNQELIWGFLDTVT
jgi:hypothetical protein